METLHFTQAMRKPAGYALGIGKFDGLHLGHRAIIAEIHHRARACGCVPAVFTFHRYPMETRISSWDEKLRLLEAGGIQVCIWSDFAEISSWEPRRFVEFLSGIGVRELVVGFNFRFGVHRTGTVAMLKDFGKTDGFGVTEVAPVQVDGEPVNSTRIRRMLKTGDVARATMFLGRYYSFQGNVVHGSEIGRKFGFPTANLETGERLLLPDGVYAGWTVLDGKTYPVAVSIGVSKTVGDTRRKTEVHILDFSGDLYGRTLSVSVFSRVRGFLTFSSTEALREQIGSDLREIRGSLAANPLEYSDKPQ